jgi:uncharacterized protein (DUF1330 family)
MPAYIIALRESTIRDPAELEAYGAKAMGAMTDKVSPLVVYGGTHALEGDAPDGTVVLQFPTVDDAKAWYNSSAYQAAIPHRQAAADYRMFIVEGM